MFLDWSKTKLKGRGGTTNERPRTDHVTLGLMRGLKKLHLMAHPFIQWGRFSEKRPLLVVVGFWTITKFISGSIHFSLAFFFILVIFLAMNNYNLNNIIQLSMFNQIYIFHQLPQSALRFVLFLFMLRIYKVFKASDTFSNI